MKILSEERVGMPGDVVEGAHPHDGVDDVGDLHEGEDDRADEEGDRLEKVGRAV